jgi:hypothetical protein
MIGGQRPGAGRKKGSLNKRTLAKRRMVETAVQTAKKTGKLPHEILLAICQGHAKEVLGRDVTVKERIECLKAAAPYYAPRQYAVAAKVTMEDNPYEELLRHAEGRSRGLPNGDRTGLEKPSMPNAKTKH